MLVMQKVSYVGMY